ncbi:phage head closure protein [Luteolibacter luteus]|uniref:Phage head closure protein n=1 Tax=Luteolibacter luteus TaxID=2728835 RepID=A0A858RF68_9BACT|nr:phage head closure protein [Luteolibacter luteus]QJE95204.1 phage head closure protein [Luteolibacter luteus]
MNPGLLNQRIRFERQTTSADETGQPIESWLKLGGCAARRKPVTSRARTEQVIADRDTERRTMVFQMRSRPFCSLYKEGDRLVELKRTDFPETVWKVIGWAEIEGTNGMYVEVTTEQSGSRH